MTTSCHMQCGSRPHRDLHGHWHHDVPVGGHTECQHIRVRGEDEDKENTDGAECSEWYGVKYKPAIPSTPITPPTSPILPPPSYTYCICICTKSPPNFPSFSISPFHLPHTLHPPTSSFHQPLSTPPSQLPHTHHPISSHPTYPNHTPHTPPTLRASTSTSMMPSTTHVLQSVCYSILLYIIWNPGASLSHTCALIGLSTYFLH